MDAPRPAQPPRAPHKRPAPHAAAPRPAQTPRAPRKRPAPHANAPRPTQTPRARTNAPRQAQTPRAPNKTPPPPALPAFSLFSSRPRYGSIFPIIRGNGIVSRTWCRPQIHGDGALDAEAEAGVRERAVAAQVEVPLERLARQLVLARSRASSVREVVLALAAADDLAVALGREHVHVEREPRVVRVALRSRTP